MINMLAIIWLLIGWAAILIDRNNERILLKQGLEREFPSKFPDELITVLLSPLILYSNIQTQRDILS